MKKDTMTGSLFGGTEQPLDLGCEKCGRARSAPAFGCVGKHIPLVALSRTGDPSSSALAAARITVSGKLSAQCQLVLEALRNNPDSTSAELAVEMEVDRYLTARRLPDLRRAGAVVQGPTRKCGAHGGTAVTWKVVA